MHVYVYIYIYIVTDDFLPGHKSCAVVGILKDTRNHSLGEEEREREGKREREKRGEKVQNFSVEIVS